MSYQFEDDSALEELLNQQLNRKRQQPARSSLSARQQPAPASSSSSLKNNRPSTGGFSGNKYQRSIQFEDEQPAKSDRGNFASWLQSEPQATVTTPNSSSLKSEVNQKQEQTTIDGTGISKQNEIDLDVDLNEERLQEMSKQRLIQLILNQVAPSLKQLKQLLREQKSSNEFKKLQEELEMEQAKVESMKNQHVEQMKLVEENWSRLNGQLERNISLSEKQLKETIESLKARLSNEQLERDEWTEKLIKNYEQKLEETKVESEARLKRRDELHKLELESKLRVDYNLVKMETIFLEWSKMLEKTIGDLDNQFKLVQCLLDKQACEIKSSNEDLNGKSKVFNEKLEKFELHSSQMNELVKEFKSILPKFFDTQQENQNLTKQTNTQLEEFAKTFERLMEKEEKCQSMKEELMKTKEELERDKFQIILDSQRVSTQEERLSELLETNKIKEEKLEQQKSAQSERDGQLEELRGSLIQRTALIKEQNYELHLVRRRLTGKEEELSRLESVLSAREDKLKIQQVEVRTEGAKLSVLRSRTQKELNQLKRVQKSLLCSICLDRLFNGQQQQSQKKDISSGNNKHNSQQQQQQLDSIQQVKQQRFLGTGRHVTQTNQVAPLIKHRDEDDGGGGDGDDVVDDDDDELDADKVWSQLETERRQLETESKYAQLLSAGAN